MELQNGIHMGFGAFYEGYSRNSSFSLQFVQNASKHRSMEMAASLVFEELMAEAAESAAAVQQHRRLQLKKSAEKTTWAT